MRRKNLSAVTGSLILAPAEAGRPLFLILTGSRPTMLDIVAPA